MRRRVLAATLPLVVFVTSPLVTCGARVPSESTKLADDDDVRASAVVQMIEGARSESNGTLPTTSPPCTGVLISPRLVLTAAHCFGTGASGTPTRGWLTGGDWGCVVVDAHDAIVASGGCGQVAFTDVHGRVREVQRVRRVRVPRAVARDDAASAHAADLALVWLDHRATPRTRARATPIAPWLDDDLPADLWRGRSTVFFGWGDEGPIRADASSCEPLSGGAPARALHYWDEKPLDAIVPIDDAPIDGVDAGGSLFLQSFDAFGDASGFLHPGDSGAPMLVKDASGALRVAGVASMHWCEKHAVGCDGTGLRMTGVLENLWARTMDARSGNLRLLRTFAIGEDGAPLGADVPNPGCDADPPTPDPDDPDCDLVPTHGTSSRPPDDCPFTYDPDQSDQDGDGVGDACEAPQGTPGAT